MLLSSAAILLGFILLIWGADRFVIGAAAAAQDLGIPTLIIGLVVLGFGTSAPEMLVSTTAAAAGSPHLAIGNALGSNITNIMLVLGVTALVTPLAVRSETLRREYPILVIATLATFGLLIDGELSQVDAIIMLVMLVAIMASLVWLAMNSRNGDPLPAEIDEEIPKDMPLKTALFWIVIGLLVLIGSSKLLVWGAVNIATTMGISELVIGLTVVAIGTSLPELAASVMSALKGEDDLAIGNVLGSNLFNTLAVLPIPGLFASLNLADGVLERDLPLVIGLTLLMFVLVAGWRGKSSGGPRMGRFAGGLLLVTFVAYQGILFTQTA